ncbi:MAG: beta strand repeat-containing protein [Candidatus Acidiferrales bacterium]
MRIGTSSIAFAVIAVAAGLAIVGCGGGNGGGSSSTPASGVVTVYPGTASVPLSSQVQFSAFLPSQPGATFSWSVSGGSGNGTINADGLYTPPETIPTPATVTITAADTAATSEIGTAAITLTAAQGVTVSPVATPVSAGTTQVFTATVAGSPVTPTWEVNGAAGGNATVGAITTNGRGQGVYVAPLTPPSGGTVTITAVSGGNSGTAAATIVFSNASLSGTYAFSYSGGDSSGNPIAVAGSFTTNPSIGAISGIEDYNSDGSTTVALALPVSGQYQVNPDGSGSAILNNAATIDGTETWQFTLGAGISGGASHHALLVRFDSTATGSGSIDQQNTAELNSLSSVSGNYVFSLSGLDASGGPLQFTGMFNADGAGNIPLNSAEEDINDAGNTTLNAPDLSLHGTYSLDAGNPSSGRGYLTLSTTNSVYPSCDCQFAFYMVDSTHLKLVQIGRNNTELLSGDAYAAPNTLRGSYALASLNGNYAFTLGGVDSNLNAYAQGGVFSANGAGGITGGVVDTNNSGSTRLNQSVSTSTYSVDASLGRIALPLTYGNTTANYGAYIGSNGLIELISLESNFLDSGSGYLQTSTAAPQGAFALNLTGIVNSSGGSEEDVAGQIVIPGGSAPTGNLAVNNSGNAVAGVPLGSASSVGTPATNGRGTASVASHLDTYPLVYYTIDGNTVLVLESDGSRTMTGVLSRQF